jgi:hypothetical protein
VTKNIKNIVLEKLSWWSDLRRRHVEYDRQQKAEYKKWRENNPSDLGLYIAIGGFF